MSRITIVIEDAGSEVVFSRREEGGPVSGAWKLASMVCDRIDELGAIEVEPEECECDRECEAANA